MIRGMKTDRLNIGIVNFPMSKLGSKAGIIPLSHLLKILFSFSQDIYIIMGNFGIDILSNEYAGIHIVGINHKTGTNTFTRIIKYIYTQLKISYTLAKTTRNVDLWIFFIGGDTLVLPMLTAKLLRKKVILAFASSSILGLKSTNDNLLKHVEILSKINCMLSNRIILYSPNLIKEGNLEKYRNKICIAHEHFLDFGDFKIERKFDERENLVGYIGRLSEEKGILNFVKAIPEVLKERDDLEFLIGGDGQLRNEIEADLDENNLNRKVKLVGWIPHDKLPDYLNELKLVVLPSYTEGLPNIMLEAMACGTPVLASPVGSIPDLIEDGKTGFILGNNSPECIAKNVIRVLEHPNRDKIVKNARKLIEKEYTYEGTAERYRKILENIRWRKND